MLVAIECDERQMNMLRADARGYKRIMDENPNAIIIICQDNSCRILHDSAGEAEGARKNKATLPPKFSL